MNLWQALLYFLREAALSLVRSWKVSLVAILTIALGLFLSGLVLTLTHNLGRSVSGWAGDARVVVYFEPEASEEEIEAVNRVVAAAPWIGAAERISSRQAAERFRDNFGGLGDLLDNWSDSPLPPSLEATLRSPQPAAAEVEAWLEALRQLPGVDLVDDDREWLRQVQGTIGVVRTVGLALAAALLIAAVFTTASVVRLTAYLYLDEIAVMRLVGATEFFIRGPFWLEGLLQGLLAGALAVLGLETATAILRSQAGSSLWLTGLVEGRLPWPWILGLILVGALAGLLGAVLSLRRERLQFDDEV